MGVGYFAQGAAMGNRHWVLPAKAAGNYNLWLLGLGVGFTGAVRMDTMSFQGYQQDARGATGCFLKGFGSRTYFSLSKRDIDVVSTVCLTSHPSCTSLSG